MAEFGGISTSMYPVGAAGPPDAMQTLMRFAQTQNLLNQNAMFQQEYRARNAMGPILQQAINPSTGELDIGKFLIHGAANPDVAWKMPEITLQMIQRRYMQAETVAKELGNAKERYAAIGDVMGGLYAKSLDEAGNDPRRAKLTYNDMIGAIAPLIGTHRISSAEVVSYLNGLATLPKVRDASGQMVPDPRALAVHARQWADTTRGVTGTLTSVEQAIAPHVTGGQTTLVRGSPRTGDVSPVGVLPHTFTPEQLNTMVERIKPGTNVKERVPMWQMLNLPAPAGARVDEPILGPRRSTMGNLTDPGTTVTAGPAQDLPVPGAGAPGGAVPSGAAPAPLPGLAPGAVPQGAPLPGAGPQGTQFPAQTTLDPVKEEALKHFTTYMKESNDEAGHALKMNQVIDALEQANKHIRTGGGAEYYVRAASLLQGLGVHDSIVDKVANGNLAASQVSQKLQLQLGTALLRAALLPGAGRITNAEFSSFQRQNPNIDTDPRAVKEMFSFLRRVNNISVQKQQTLSDVYARHIQGGTLPRGMADITQFDPWWNAHVVRSGAISLSGAHELGLGRHHPEYRPDTR